MRPVYWLDRRLHLIRYDGYPDEVAPGLVKWLFRVINRI